MNAFEVTLDKSVCHMIVTYCNVINNRLIYGAFSASNMIRHTTFLMASVETQLSELKN